MQYWQFEMPLTPTLATSVTEPQALGVIAVAANGVVIYGAQEGGGTNAVEPGTGAEITDAQYWYGHAAQSGDWHYHASELGQQALDSSTFLGWAMDGYELYGPLDDDSVLDACNGRTVDGVYRYHVRSDAQVDGDADYCDGSSAAIQWNYVLGCYSGDISAASVQDSSTATLPSDCVAISTTATTATLFGADGGAGGQDEDEDEGSTNVGAIVGGVLGGVGGLLALGGIYYYCVRDPPMPKTPPVNSAC